MDLTDETKKAIVNISTMWLHKILRILDYCTKTIIEIKVDNYEITDEHEKLENVRQLLRSMLDYSTFDFHMGNCEYGYKEMYKFTRLLVIITSYYCGLLLKHVNETSKSYDIITNNVLLYSQIIESIFNNTLARRYKCNISKVGNLISYCKKERLNKCDEKLKNVDNYNLIKSILKDVHDEERIPNIPRPYDFSNVKLENDMYKPNEMFDDNEESIDLSKFY